MRVCSNNLAGKLPAKPKPPLVRDAISLVGSNILLGGTNTDSVLLPLWFSCYYCNPTFLRAIIN
jgi:hypothetical protein